MYSAPACWHAALMGREMLTGWRKENLAALVREFGLTAQGYCNKRCIHRLLELVVVA